MNPGCDDHNGANTSVNIVKLRSMCHLLPKMQFRALGWSIIPDHRGAVRELCGSDNNQMDNAESFKDITHT
jgi:hypothetical protein